jgi:tRNA(Ile2) C34 agmatinyltransferase TiaS
MGRDLVVPADPPCVRCDGTRLVPLTFGDRQTGYDQPGFKCADCGARFQSLHNQRVPRAI